MFSSFNLKNGLEFTPWPYNSYGDKNPPFKISSFSGSQIKDFEENITLYKANLDNANLTIQSSGDKKLLKQYSDIYSLWHYLVKEKLSSHAYWEECANSLSNPSLKNRLENLKIVFFDFLINSELKSTFLIKQYKLLNKINSYYKKCFSDLKYAHTYSHQIAPKKLIFNKTINIPGFFCPEFNARLSAYLAGLKNSIEKELERFVPTMIGRLRVAHLSNNRQNGDILFYVAKELENLVKKSLFSEDIFPTKVELFRSALEKSPQAFHQSTLEYFAIPQKPVEDLDFEAFQSFYETFNSLEKKLSPLEMKWQHPEQGICVDFAYYESRLIILPTEKADMLISNLPNTSTILEMSWEQILNFNEGFRTLSTILKSFPSINLENSEKEISRKYTSRFSDLNNHLDHIHKLANAIKLSSKGMETCWQILWSYREKSSRTKEAEEFYNAWDLTLNRAFSSFDQGVSILIILFKKWATETFSLEKGLEGPYPTIQIAPVINAIKQYHEMLDRLDILKKEKTNFFKTIYEEKIDQIFFTLFIRNLQEERSEFQRITSFESHTFIHHDTPAAHGLVDLLHALSPQQAHLVKEVGDAWLDTRKTTLHNLEKALNLNIFNESNIPGDRKLDQNHLLYSLLKSIEKGCESWKSPSINLLQDMDRKQKLQNPNDSTLFDEWKKKQKNIILARIVKIGSYVQQKRQKLSPQDLLKAIDPLLPLDQLEPHVKQHFKESIEIYISSFQESYIHLLPLLKKIDIELVEKHVKTHLQKLLKHSFQNLCNEVFFLEKLLKEYPNLKNSFQATFASEISLHTQQLLEKIAAKKDPSLPFVSVCEKVHLPHLVKLWHLLIGENKPITLLGFNSLKIEEIVDHLFFDALKSRILMEKDLSFEINTFRDFPLTEIGKSQLIAWVEQEVSKKGWMPSLLPFLNLYPKDPVLQNSRHLSYLKGLELSLQQKDYDILNKFCNYSNQSHGLFHQLFGNYSMEALSLIEDYFVTNPLTNQTLSLLKLYFPEKSILSPFESEPEKRTKFDIIKIKFLNIKSLKKDIDDWILAWRNASTLDTAFWGEKLLTIPRVSSDGSFYRCLFLYLENETLDILNKTFNELKESTKRREALLTSSTQNCQSMGTFFNSAHINGFITEGDLKSFKIKLEELIISINSTQHIKIREKT